MRVDLRAVVNVLNVAANVCVEENRVCDLVTVRAETFYRNVHVKPNVLVDDAEGNRRGRSVFVADNFFGVKVVDSLVTAGIAAESKTFLHREEDVLNIFGKRLVAVKEARFGGLVVNVFAAVRAEVDDLALLDNHHALPVVDRNFRAVGYDVVVAVV